MSELLDERYLTWLYSQVANVEVKSPRRTYWSLLKQLYRTEFVWIIPNDDNRVEDGKELRLEFMQEEGVDEIDPDWMGLGCSFLEMLIALSRRLTFEAGGKAAGWFWHMIENLEIVCNDRQYNEQHETRIGDALATVVWRQYAPNGRGGLFPLEEPYQDQTEVEIWYQFNAYLLERS